MSNFVVALVLTVACNVFFCSGQTFGACFQETDTTQDSLPAEQEKQQPIDETQDHQNGSASFTTGFEDGVVGERIDGWWGPEPDGFLARVSDIQPKEGKQCMRLQATSKPNPSGFAVLNRNLDLSKFRGKRIRFRAAVRAEVDDGRNQAQLWFRVNRNRSIAAFDNMGKRPIKTRNGIITKSLATLLRMPRPPQSDCC